MAKLREDVESCPVCGHYAGHKSLPHHLAAGTLLNKKFLVGRAIGEGGFGITYIGLDVNLETRIAIKEYYPKSCAVRNNADTNSVTIVDTAGKGEYFTAKKHFLKEAQTLAKFSRYYNIVSVRDYFEENETAYIIMEYLEGVNLRKYLKKNGKQDAVRFVKWLIPLLEALEKIHEQGLIHRDISPDNIIVEDDRLVLIDFGAARESDSDRSLSVIVKKGYAPAEQYSSHGKQGPWTDIYAICATIYEAVTGVVPPESSERILEDELIPPSETGADIPEYIEKALLKGLSNRFRDRQQTVGELIADLTDPNECSSMSATIHIVSERRENSSSEEEDSFGEKTTVIEAAVVPSEKAAVEEKNIHDISGTKDDEPDLKKEEKKVYNDVHDVREEPKPEENTGKKGRNIIIGVAAMLIVVAGISVSLLRHSENDGGVAETSGSTSELIEVTSEKTESSSDAEIRTTKISVENTTEKVEAAELSDKLSDFTFCLDGKIYTLPFDYKQFVNDGWTILDNNIHDTDTINGYSNDLIKMSKAGNSVYVDIINMSGNRRQISDCKIGGIHVDRGSISSPDFFSVSKNVNVSMDSEQIQNLLGTADDFTVYDDHSTLQYKFGDDSYVKFSCYNEGELGRYSGIVLKNFVADENDATEVSVKVPEYLSSYKAPESLGEDNETGNVEFGGKLYRLPAPVSEFLDDGWEIVSKSGGVASGRISFVDIKRDDKKLTVSVRNFGDYQTIPENCAVYSISVYDTDNIEFTVPGNISVGKSSKEDVDAWVTGDYSCSKWNDNYTYSNNNYDKDFSVDVRVDIKTEKVSYIKMSFKEWNYD